MAFCNDGVEMTGIERETRAEAINDLKEGFRFDFCELGHDPGFDYYIEKYTEIDDTLYVRDMQYFKLSMGKRGGVKCERTKAI
jgi:hypothetical protein